MWHVNTTIQDTSDPSTDEEFILTQSNDCQQIPLLSKEQRSSALSNIGEAENSSIIMDEEGLRELPELKSPHMNNDSKPSDCSNSAVVPDLKGIVARKQHHQRAKQRTQSIWQPNMTGHHQKAAAPPEIVIHLGYKYKSHSI